MNPEKPTDIPETVFSEKTRPGGSSRVEKQGDAAQRTPTNLSWNHSLPSTQTVMVSPLSRTEGPWSRMPPEGSGWEANVQKLAGLEKEAQRLRRLLNLEVTKTTQGTMTTADRSSEKSTAGPETRPASRAGREVGCQTDLSEVSRIYTQYFVASLWWYVTKKITYERSKMFYWRPSAQTNLVWRSSRKLMSNPLFSSLCVRAAVHPAAWPRLQDFWGWWSWVIELCAG